MFSSFRWCVIFRDKIPLVNNTVRYVMIFSEQFPILYIQVFL